VKTAAIFGATGLVGAHALTLLERDAAIERIHVFARRELDIPSVKILFHRSDLMSPETIASDMRSYKPDFAICALGTTMARAGSREEFYRVDHDLVMNAARALRMLGVGQFGIVSSVRTRRDARAFYLRVKAETERDLEALDFPSLVILRPSVIIGTRSGDPAGLRALVALSRVIAPALLGPLTHYRPVAAEIVAHALIEKTRTAGPGLSLFENESLVSE
jgi:uncharacterized protein YbjT (DUF2867 family)